MYVHFRIQLTNLKAYKPAIIAHHQGKPQETCINSKACCSNPTGVMAPSPALCIVCSPSAFC